MISTTTSNQADSFGWGPNHPLPTHRTLLLFSHISGKRILDVGCGFGHLVNSLSTQGFNATGIDLNPNSISFAKNNYSGCFRVANATNLPFAKSSFNTVILHNVLEHLDHDTTAISEALRVGSRVVITVPHTTAQNLKNRGLIYSHYQDKTHLRTYTQKSLTELINQAGGKILKLKLIEPLPNREIFSELFSGSTFYRKLISRLIFSLLKPSKYYLEILAIIK